MHHALRALDWDKIGSESIELLRDLLRFDTTNPPGNEKACAEFLAGFLEEAGIETELLFSALLRRGGSKRRYCKVVSCCL